MGSIVFRIKHLEFQYENLISPLVIHNHIRYVTPKKYHNAWQ